MRAKSLSLDISSCFILIIEPDRVLGTALVRAMQEKTSFQMLLVPALTRARKVLRRLPCDLVLVDDRLSQKEDLDQLHTIAGCENVPILTFALNERPALDEQLPSYLGAIVKSVKLLQKLQVLPGNAP